ncbi:vegetative storage protein 2-like isoform X2 [Panicum virgatum]|uniref:vegetative storage protein 2-like isoform X2 n=1 Tax=Panicum virgatum TaxID=38727 RepID=UPI0019D5912B|nr:vegetative storage protein 2-like isoform X2 [Panicum virgatum]
MEAQTAPVRRQRRRRRRRRPWANLKGGQGSPEYRGQSSSVFKSAMRKQLVDEGYRIRGNVGDQWTDLQGDCAGDRVFKIPNPMYFVP